MTPPLFLVESLADGDLIELSGDEGRHAARVKRLHPGEAIWIGDGRGAVAIGSVVGVTADVLTVAVTERRFEPEPQPRLVVAQALPKGDRGELAVELMTELGVDAVVPWAASRCIAQWHGARGDKARAKWQATAREAAKQSRRAWVPEVEPLATTKQLATRCFVPAAGGKQAGLSPLPGANLPLVLHEAATTPLGSVDLPRQGEIVLVVGPEGGTADDELEALGGTPVRLGGPVLRTSTAGAAALAVLSHRLGRWD